MAAGQGPSLERVVAEAYVKAAEVILEARVWSPGKQAAEPPKQRAWFNLEVGEVEGAAKALERWRREAGLPLVLEIFLQPWGAQAAAAAGGGQQDRAETLLERWVVHYFPQLPEGPGRLSRSQLSRLNPSSVYKRLVVTLRSLCTYVRVLPAYRMFRACKRQRGANFTLAYRLHSTLPGRSAAATLGARRMQAFRFGPVDTPYGQFRIGVEYQPASTVTILEQTTSPPPLPQIISDYMGGGGDGGTTLPLRHAMSASAFPARSPPRGGAALGVPPLALSPQAAALPGSPAGGLPIRRSWSTSQRAAASPLQLASPPSSELPSPVSARDTPYGSAPQPASLPAMLRALSTSAGKFAVGSPSGRPPLPQPPRTSAPMASPAGRPHASGIPAGSSPASGMPILGAAAAEERDEGSEGSTPRADCGGSARQSSAPMCIPGRAGFGGGGVVAAMAQGRRLRSSNDLWAMQQAAHMRKPLSAPAVSHMQQAGGGGGAPAAAAPAAPASRGGEGESDAPVDPSPPAARLPLLPGTLECESSAGSAASSLYPTSCSPQLPFAFTPSAQSLVGFGGRGLERTSPRVGRTLSGGGSSGSVPHVAAAAAMAAQATQQRTAAGGGGGSSAGSAGGGGGGFSPGSGGSSGGGVTGREVPASTALMRRPSWSSRSSAYAQLPGEASQQGVGYSVSPMADPILESMLGGSTPRQFTLAAGLPSPLPGGPGLLSHVSSAFSGAAPPMLTYPSVSGEMSGGVDEADALPFALDEGSSPVKPRSPAPGTAPGGAAAQPPQPAAAPAGAPAAGAPGPDADADVGAFVRLIQEAPPLRLHASRPPTRAASADFASARLAGAVPGTSASSDGSGATCLSDGRGLTLQAGLRQFSQIKERLKQRGVCVAPCPAEA